MKPIRILFSSDRFDILLDIDINKEEIYKLLKSDPLIIKIIKDYKSDNIFVGSYTEYWKIKAPLFRRKEENYPIYDSLILNYK